MSKWLERAEREIDEEHESGNLSDKEYRQAMNDLYAEYQEQREEAMQKFQEGWDG
jgi:polyhydroxyalkanoate synthesis regulator phasin